MEPPTFYRTIQIDGLSIFYREAGPKDASTILLLHGLPSSSRMFEPLFTWLSDAIIWSHPRPVRRLCRAPCTTFLTVDDIERSARYYEKAFGARILSLGDGNAPGYLQLANIWMILNVGGGPTPDKPTVTLSVPDPNHINSFMNFRVADIHACYELWKSRGAEFITEPMEKYGEIRCYMRDPDGYIIEVGQSTTLTYG